MKKLVILLLSLFSISAFANKAENIVEKMVSAMKNQNYQGTYVYLHGDMLETIRLKHFNYNGMQKETLLSLTGEAREIIRSADTVSCILPSKNAIIIDKARSQYKGMNKLSFHPEKIKNYYDFNMMGEDRIAGRKSFVVHIAPKDQYRFAHILWIDKENYLLLKSKITDDKNVTVEQIMFTEITLIKNEDLQSIAIASNTKTKNLKMMVNNNEQMLTNQSNWVFSNIPPGYKFKDFFKKTMSQNDVEVKQWLFSDGLTSYSIFIKDNESNHDMPKDIIKMGSVNVFSVQQGSYLITVMGEVPDKTIKMASSGISKKK